MEKRKEIIEAENFFKRNVFTSTFTAIFLALPSLIILHNLNSNLHQELVGRESFKVKCPEAPKYWGVCLNKWNPNGNLRTMNRVFDRLGYEAVDGSKGDDWDVMWSIEHPFNRTKTVFEPVFGKLKFHQRINHFPGNTFITSKSFMSSTNRDVKNVLPGFIFPGMIGEFKDFVKKNPKARFVEKWYDNRGVRLVSRKNIIFDKSKKFYQLFMEKPFLVEGRLMDFSTYVLISSVDPLRIYRFDTELLLRFCPEPYYPFNPENLDKYVVSESRKTFLEIPTMKAYFENYGCSFKVSIEDYFRRQGKNVTELWKKIDETIVQLVLNNEKHLVEQTAKLLKPTRHFFELVRVDFLLNEDLEPFLTEVNMSPNLVPTSDDIEQISEIYEQIVYDTLQIVGAGSKMDLMLRYDYLTNNMVSNSKNIAVKPELCIENNCSRNCEKPECAICAPCLADKNLGDIHRAYREHVKLGGFKTLFPSKQYFSDDFISNMTASNKLSLKWFRAKCEEDPGWC